MTTFKASTRQDHATDTCGIKQTSRRVKINEDLESSFSFHEEQENCSPAVTSDEELVVYEYDKCIADRNKDVNHYDPDPNESVVSSPCCIRSVCEGKEEGIQTKAELDDTSSSSMHQFQISVGTPLPGISQNQDLNNEMTNKECHEKVIEVNTVNGCAQRDADVEDSSANEKGVLVSLAEKVAETLVDFKGTVSEAVTHAATDVVDHLTTSAAIVKDAFVDELHHADQGDDNFLVLNTALTRGFGLLPGDVVEAACENGDSLLSLLPPPLTPSQACRFRQEEDDPTKELSDSDFDDSRELQDKVANDGDEASFETVPVDLSGINVGEEIPAKIPLSAYVLLLSAVVALSAIGPLLAMQEGVNATLKITWRQGCTALLFSPLALRSITMTSTRESLQKMTVTKWVIFVLTGAFYAAYCVFYAASLNFTTVGNATILSNAQAIILLIGRVCVGNFPSLQEGIGALIAFGGAVLCSRDSAEQHGGGGAATLLGDFLALMSAVSGVIYIVFAKTVRPNIELALFMFLLMVSGTIFSFIFLAVQRVHFSFDRNINEGVFGWMNLGFDRLPLQLIMVVVCNVFGAMGYIRAMQYFSNLVILVAGLAEPVVAELLAVCLGVGKLPEWKGWVGNALVAAGTFAVIYKASLDNGKSSKTNVTERKSESSISSGDDAVDASPHSSQTKGCESIDSGSIETRCKV